MAIFYEAERVSPAGPVLINVEMIKSVVRRHSGQAIIYFDKSENNPFSYLLNKSYEEVVADLRVLTK